MPSELPGWTAAVKPALAVLFLALFWSWETWWPLIAGHPRRWRHARRNLTIAILNTMVLGVLFGAATVGVALWAAKRQFGLLHWLTLASPYRLISAILLLDGWLYTWPRLNHRVPFL